MVTLCHVGHRHDIHELQQLLVDLVDHLVGADRDQRQSRVEGILGSRHRQRLNVVTARREHRGHARQGARFVLQQNGNDVAHDDTSGCSPSFPGIAMQSQLPETRAKCSVRRV